MNSSGNLNLKNQDDITDFEIGSFNEEEEQFMNKKQLVHIDDDTSINVDMSEDDRSKSSTLKKSFLINNMSVINEEFPFSNQLVNKKENKNNDMNDLTSSADFYNSEGIGSYPLMMSDKKKEIMNQKYKLNNYIKENNINNLNNLNINDKNDEIIESLETKIDNNGYFFSSKPNKNEQFIDENNMNINNSSNKKINIKNQGANITIKDIDDEDEDAEEYDLNNNNNQFTLQNKQPSYKNNPNVINNNNNYNHNQNHNFNNLQENSFSLYILANYINKLSGSVNSSGQTFGLAQSESKEYQNKYTQLESKYNALLSQNKKLEEKYQELKSSNESVLELLTYWQKFYLEILEIVKPKNSKNNKNDISISDFMDDPYRIQLINDVKKLVLIARDKVYNKFYVSQINHFNIKGKEKMGANNDSIKIEKEIIVKKNDFNEISNIIKIESFMYEKKEKNNDKKILKEKDDINSLPPIKKKEQTDIGINTDITGEYSLKPIIKEVIKEVEVIKKVPLQKFEEKNLKISSKVQIISFINISSKNKKLKISSESINFISIPKPKIIEQKPKFNELKMNSSIKLYFKGIAPSLLMSPTKFKKNTMHKFASVQTEMTYKNLNSIETLNKACSSQLLNSQKEKEKMQKLYEEKIESLTKYINENIKIEKEEKKENERYNNNNNNNIIDNNSGQKKEDEIPPVLNTSLIFLPEMIPPENTYKIFMHCVKHFKYEEDIYKKYLEEEDLYTLKAFVEKMEKYLRGASLPLVKYSKKRIKDKSRETSKEKNSNIIINNKYIKPESSLRKRYNENSMNNTKQKSSNSKSKMACNSENKYALGEKKVNSIYNNNSTFNKYKAAILALKEY